mmetsp:Transcript_1675/g.5396  ORF Transcript_1675/g.5396 Transcript_1675/m.5396 type:complete len:228 (+) Transcript_1675:153-836(+)
MVSGAVARLRVRTATANRSAANAAIATQQQKATLAPTAIATMDDVSPSSSAVSRYTPDSESTARSLNSIDVIAKPGVSGGWCNILVQQATGSKVAYASALHESITHGMSKSAPGVDRTPWYSSVHTDDVVHRPNSMWPVTSSRAWHIDGCSTALFVVPSSSCNTKLERCATIPNETTGTTNVSSASYTFDTKASGRVSRSTPTLLTSFQSATRTTSVPMGSPRTLPT